MSATSGRLVLVGTPIGNLGDMSPRAVDALRTADIVMAEDTRHSRKLFTHFEIPVEGRLVSGHAHNEMNRVGEVLDAVGAGKTVVYISDAGMPAIQDPGALLVAACAEAGLAVEVVPGPSALLAGLVLSGLPTGRFVFEGFLERKGLDRQQRLVAIAEEARTVIFYEAPHRLAALVDDLCSVCGEDRPIALARELTKLHEAVWRGTAGDARAMLVDHPARGEYVVIVGPKPVVPRMVTDDEIVAALQSAFASGASARDAAAAAATALGVPKRRAYDLAVGVRRA